MKNLETFIEENAIDTEIVNVDFELAVAEAAINGLESFEFEGEVYETTLTSEEAENYWGTVSEALTNAQRRKKSIAMKKGKAGRIRKKKIAEKKLSSPDKLKGKASKKARKVIEKKLLKGKDKSELSFAQRAQLEKKVDKKKGAIKRIAKRSLKDVKKADRERVKSRRAHKEDFENVDESLSQGMDQTLNAINLLTRSLKSGSNLNKAEDKAAEGKYAKDFDKMFKAMLVVGDTYSDIVMDIETNMREDVQYDEAFRFSRGHKHTENAINLLSKALQPGSALMKAVNKDLGGSYRSEFGKMGDLMDDIEAIWVEIGRDYETQHTSVGEDTEVTEGAGEIIAVLEA